MANGIMTGSGTQTDPYLVEDVYDFCNITSGSKSSAYYKLVNDIDFNDHSTYKYGISTSLSASSYTRYIDGDGHEVRNMVCTNDSTKFSFGSSGTVVSNTNFANIIMNSISSSGKIQISSPKFINCNFSYYLINSGLSSIFNTGNDLRTFTNCTFNIAGKMIAAYFDASFNMCHINFKDLNVDSSGLFQPGYNNTVFDNTYITGSINSSKLQYLFYTNSYSLQKFSNSYIAVDARTITTLEYVLSSGSNAAALSSCFIDNTLMPNMQAKSASGASLSNVYLLTSEQFKDNDYLNSIGFLAIPVE